MTQAFYLLVDCNNFYVSCERVFNPLYRNKPVIILSNNDGCAIARSQEAKDLGIKMGEPYFKISKLCQAHKVHVLSSNYELYGDMSERVMSVLRQFSPKYEIYSIDEAFLKITSSSPRIEFETFIKSIRQRVLQWTGIPVSIGAGPTKTLAKIANYWAKKQSGILVLQQKDEIKSTLGSLPVSDIWGVGHRRAQTLKRHNIQSALDLQRAPIKFIRKIFTVTGEKLALELRGVPCLDLEADTAKKQIQYTRSFGQPITTLKHMLEALTDYTARAAEKLRQEKLLTNCISFYLRTSKWDKNPVYIEAVLPLEQATDDTRVLVKMITRKAFTIFKEGRNYKKAGVRLMDLKSPSTSKNLFKQAENSTALMKTIDAINQTFGKNTLLLASQLNDKSWAMTSSNRTPRYTTCWDDLVQV
tara:strand:+ start:8850 stop:10094 length:1245 start_codon:yes stop_codon:yes gene_type:complete